MSEQAKVRRVMISSTALDLPEHRRHARDACERMTMLPLVMEQVPASLGDALTISRDFVDKADLYLGIFAFRYGYVPEGQTKSITELEYDLAIDRKIPTLIFIAHDEHPVSFRDVERGVGAPKLEALKERLKKEHVVRFFRSPEELRTEIISALAAYRQDDAARLHYIAEIPKPPAPWVAHWYSLLGNRRLVGRQAELELLTDWVARPSGETYNARLLALVAIGGMGKSALAWTWWNEIAPYQMKPLAGRMWWSFYESDARFENFTARALAYLTGRPRAETEKIPARDREDQVLSILDKEPHLVVLDGLERELIAYARLDASHLSDDDLDPGTEHKVELGDRTAQSLVGGPKLRQTADPRMGQFLRRLTQVRSARTLVTTRLLPFELQDFNGEPMPGTFVRFLPALGDDEALDLWRSAGISGARDALIPLFRSVAGHPLLVRALAGEIARDRRSRGDFDTWIRNHPDFNPFVLPLVQRKSHVLAFALEGLGHEELSLLRAVSAFRMPAAYETLAALLVGGSEHEQPFTNDEEFDRALADLDDRGLLGWDRRANRYDLHPIVRGVVWSGATVNDQRAVAERIRAHFEPMPTPEWAQIEGLDDLTPAIELYASLIRLGRFEEAFSVFFDRLERATLWRLSAARQRVELLEMLFPNGVDGESPLERGAHHSYALNAIALGYLTCGQPGRAVRCFERSVFVHGDETDINGLVIALCNLSGARRVTGAVHAAEASAMRALALSLATADWYNEGVCLYWVGLCRAVRGVAEKNLALNRSLGIWRAESRQGEGLVSGYLAQSAVWGGDAAAARHLADRAWELAAEKAHERDFIRAARLQGEATLILGDLDRADERLHHALTRAQSIGHVEEELAALSALAALHHRRGDRERAREYLDTVWDAAERGPYPLLHADARNVLAEIEIAEGNISAAIGAATTAYRLAWCDGPPFSYDYGLRTARAHLEALAAAEPEMPPYDASKRQPIEEISIEMEPGQEPPE